MLQRFAEFLDVVTVDRADILPSQFLENDSVDDGVFDVLFGVMDTRYDALTDNRNLGKSSLDLRLCMDVFVGTGDSAEGT